MMRKLFLFLICVAVVVASAQGSRLTINQPLGKVGPLERLTGKAPSPSARIFVIVNPVEQPQQFWVQKIATVDGKRNWTASVHFGEPGQAHHDKQFTCMAVGDPETDLHEGDVLPDWPNAKWKSEIITVTRK